MIYPNFKWIEKRNSQDEEIHCSLDINKENRLVTAVCYYVNYEREIAGINIFYPKNIIKTKNDFIFEWECMFEFNEKKFKYIKITNKKIIMLLKECVKTGYNIKKRQIIKFIY